MRNFYSILKQAFIFVLSLLVGGCSIAPRFDDQSASVKRATSKFQDASYSDVDRKIGLQQSRSINFPLLKSQAWITDRKNDELHALYRLQFNILFWTGSTDDFNLLQKIYSELEFRKILSRNEMRDFFRALITARKFELVDKFNDDIADLKQSLPQFFTQVSFEQSKPSIWFVDQLANKVTRQNIDLSAPHLLVVVSHPSCGYSAAATKQIASSSALMSRLKERMVWVTPQDSNFHFQKLQDWNKQYPELSIHFIDIAEKWSLPRTTSTPIFYLLKNGKVVEEITEWPRDGSNLPVLEEALNRHNFPK